MYIRFAVLQVRSSIIIRKENAVCGDDSGSYGSTAEGKEGGILFRVKGNEASVDASREKQNFSEGINGGVCLYMTCLRVLQDILFRRNEGVEVHFKNSIGVIVLYSQIGRKKEVEK